MSDPNWKPTPKNQVRSRNSIEQHEHEDLADARRVLLVDALGDFINSDNPLPVTATINVENLVIPVELDSENDDVSISNHLNPIFAEAADTITSAVFEEIFSFTSTDAKTKIISLNCTVSTPSLFQLKINGTVKKQLRSSPIDRNVEFLFKEHKGLALGDVLSIEAKVDRFIHASFDSFVSLEGYIKN